jgi:imidazolonepropionase-like amidohydrolase
MTTFYITADRLFDGTGTSTIIRPIVKVVDGRIESIERGLLPPPTCNGERCDFAGCTILPGFIDTHVHLIFSGLPTREEIIAQVTGESDEQLLVRALGNARAALSAGLTTVRDCGGKNRLVQEARDRIRAGQAEGADILACGGPITTTTGHCHWLGLIADSYTEVGQAAERMLYEDADFLKIMATGGNMTASSDPMQAQYDADSLKLVADIGRKAGKHAAAHVLSRVALPDVIAANYRTVEHCDWRVEEFRYEFNPELARRMIDQQQYAGLTMSGLSRRAFVPEARTHPAPASKRLDIRFACERQMIEFGVKYTLHTDAGVMLTPIDQFAIGLRAAALELRLTPDEVLTAVTRTAAEALSLADRGIVVPGKRADLVIVAGNPLQDLAALGSVRAVMKEGKWYPIQRASRSASS